MKIVTAAQMKRAEEESARRGISNATLMDNAGKALAIETEKILGDIAGRRILFLIGPGNNGGDGLVAARYIHNRGASVELYLMGRQPGGDELLSRATERSITANLASEDGDLKKLAELLSHSDAVVDAVLGTGRNRPLEGVFAAALAELNRVKKARPSLKVIALDIPTGLNADTGAIDPNSPISDYTITLGFPKPGLFNLPGAERSGKIVVVDIGIPDGAASEFYGKYLELSEIIGLLPYRSPFANKGIFGKALIVAGSVNYIGAAFLASSAAMRTGAGLTTLAIARSLQPVLAAKLTETTYLPLPESETGIVSTAAVDIIKEELPDYDVILAGPGLGQRGPAVEFMRGLFALLKDVKTKVILDADALNTLAGTPEWWRELTYDAILTPHPGEMARLTGKSIEEIQRDRLETAREAAQKWHKTLILKGAYTVIAAPDGRLAVSPFASAGLASAGTGDVLAGVIAGLTAQGLSLFDAACLGVYLHGFAGEMVKDTLGDAGMLASDLLPALPLTIKKMKEGT
jgi:NAD(P)H-hydrate epimerase